MYEQSYDGMAGKSSANEKDVFKKGGRDAYQKDMYDMMPKWTKSKVTTDPNTGISGSAGKSDGLDGPKTGKGNTQNKSQAIAVKSNDGSKDYGKGNPYSKHKMKKSKAIPKSIDDLRKMAKAKGV